MKSNHFKLSRVLVGMKYQNGHEQRLKSMKLLQPLLDNAYPRYSRYAGIASVEVSGISTIPKGPSLLVPKHRTEKDHIPIYRALTDAGICAGYIAKHSVSVPGLLVPFGLIRLSRTIDIHKLRKYLPRHFISWIVDYRFAKNSMELDYITFLLSRGEYVISFPEGTTQFDSVGKLKGNRVFQAAAAAQKAIDQKISVVPIGLEYDKNPDHEKGASAKVNFGSELCLCDFIKDGALMEDDLNAEISLKLAALSGLKL